MGHAGRDVGPSPGGASSSLRTEDDAGGDLSGQDAPSTPVGTAISPSNRCDGVEVAAPDGAQTATPASRTSSGAGALAGTAREQPNEEAGADDPADAEAADGADGLRRW